MSDSVSPIPYTGNKNCIQDTILSVMPPHKTYLEACMGSAEIFLAQSPRGKRDDQRLQRRSGEIFPVPQNSEKLSYLIGRLYLSLTVSRFFVRTNSFCKQSPTY